MVLAYYQNYHEIKQLWSDSKAAENRLPSSAPEFVKFLEFYANFDEQHYGFQINLCELFPEEHYK